MALPALGPQLTGSCVAVAHGIALLQADAMPTSGSPGYRTGAMLLYGMAAADGSSVNRRTTGLPLPAPAPLTGSCVEPSKLAPPARFGVDAVTSCGVPLTPAELRDLCRGSGGVAALGLAAAEGAAGLLPRFAGLLPGARIGAWGSADPADLEQWVSIEQEAIGAAATSPFTSRAVYTVRRGPHGPWSQSMCATAACVGISCAHAALSAQLRACREPSALQQAG